MHVCTGGDWGAWCLARAGKPWQKMGQYDRICCRYIVLYTYKPHTSFSFPQWWFKKFWSLTFSVSFYVQLFIKDAFRLCRYQWMSTALEKFLEVMSTEKKHGGSQSLVVLHPAQVSDVSNSLVVLNPAPVSEVVTENQIMSTNCLPSLLSQNSTVLESFQCSAQQC